MKLISIKSLAKCCVVLSLILTSGSEGKEPANNNEEMTKPATFTLADLKKQRKEMAHRKRRIIYNDDGWRGGEGPEEFVAKRFNHVLDTQVDSYFYCVGDGQLPPWGRETPEAIGDENQVIIGAARKAGLEIFASLRMNDAHDSHRRITYPLKLQRPDLLIGEDHWPGPYPHLLSGEQAEGAGGYPEKSVMSWFFSGLDYAEPEVRQHRLDFISQICGRYDWDGLELDYFRHALFFKFGEEEENRETMTGFISQVRQTLDEIGRARGRPYLLAIRVPPTPEWSLRSGLDVEQWLSDGSIDILIVASEHRPYTTELKKFVDIGHRYSVPVYLNASWREHTGWSSKEGTAHLSPQQIQYNMGMGLHTTASNHWALGADGIYLFNFFVPGAEIYQQTWDYQKGDQWLSELGDPATLLGLDKCYIPDTGGFSNFPGAYGYSGAGESGPFPMHLIYAKPIDIMVGDDVQEATQQSLLKEICLVVGAGNMDESEGIKIKVNGVRVPGSDIKRVAEDSFEAVLQAAVLRHGINQIEVGPGLHCAGRFSSTITGLKLWVRYSYWDKCPPVPVTDTWCRIPLIVGEDLTASPPQGKRRDIKLRIQVAGLSLQKKLSIRVNGTKFKSATASPALSHRPKEIWLEFSPEVGLFQQGENLIEAVLEEASKDTVRIEPVDLVEWSRMPEIRKAAVVIPFSQEWSFKTDPGNEGVDKTWFTVGHDDKNWDALRSDGNTGWETYGYAGYDGYAWYRSELPTVPAKKKRFAYIYFGAVDEQDWVYLNGKPVFNHTSKSTGQSAGVLWEKPFSCNISKFLDRNGPNTLAVRVHDSARMGGIWKPVQLVLSNIELTEAEVQNLVTFVDETVRIDQIRLNVRLK